MPFGISLAGGQASVLANVQPAQDSEQELFDDFDCLGSLQRTALPRQIKRSRSYEYRFDPDQDTKLHEGVKCFFSHDLSISTTIETCDSENGVIEIKLGPNQDPPPDRLSLIPNEYVSAKSIADGVFRYVNAWGQGAILSQAVDDLLCHRPPRLRAHNGGPIIPGDADLVAAAVDVVQRMDNTILCIQGPPGTGKTYTDGTGHLGADESRSAGRRDGQQPQGHFERSSDCSRSEVCGEHKLRIIKSAHRKMIP